MATADLHYNCCRRPCLSWELPFLGLHSFDYINDLLQQESTTSESEVQWEDQDGDT